MDSDLESLTNDEVAGAAATVVLLRDGERGLEVLLAERPRDRGSFAGAWVFPGGAVDDADALGGSIDTEDAARRAAVRETREEIGLELDRYDLVPFSHWTPPKNSPKQLRTTFFAVRVPDGEIRPAPDEVMAVEWLRPVDALDRHAAGSMTLWPPTWVTLHGLQHAASVDAALAELRSGDVKPYVAKLSEDGTTILWQEDDEYEAERHRQEDHPAVADEGPDAEGNQHRLVMDRLPWIYVNTMGAGF
ncbi:NUDIX domain-containing protein [Agromyces ramosus]|jgi:8-oxo-dGTP pyrophosphatase MutT (NUDIX family)|uniref:NUDIX domain-containing protein n=1 Tax=Agromyces ramosus TaxID=33879 RepID=A0A4V2EZZ1_9MICO|nr:NUDIX domain-containing protein [Agromyces ramosus]RZS68170.1 NUDIX domain-containing protein [Agromyces ramosus]